jgi:hypothetical protein
MPLLIWLLGSKAPGSVGRSPEQGLTLRPEAVVATGSLTRSPVYQPLGAFSFSLSGRYWIYSS